MLNDHMGAAVFVGDSKVVEEALSRFAHYHRAEELTTEPGAATYVTTKPQVSCEELEKGIWRTRRDRSLNNSNLEIWTRFAKHVGSAQAARSSAHNYNVALSVRVQILEVATSHGAGDLALADGCELEGLPFFGQVFEELGLAIDRYVTIAVDRLDGHAAHGWGIGFGGCWWGHGTSISKLG